MSNLTARFTLATWLCFGCGVLCGQEEGGAPTPVADARGEISSQLMKFGAEVGEDPGGVRGKVVVAYQEALSYYNESEALGEALRELKGKTAGVGAELKRLAGQDPEGDEQIRRPPDSDEAPLETLLPRFETAKATLSEARLAVQAHAAEESQRMERAASLPELVARSNAELVALPERETSAAAESELEKAEFLRTEARRTRLEKQVEVLRAEMEYLQASAELFATKGGIALQRQAALEDSVESWQRLIDRRRLEETGDAVERASEDVERFKNDPEAKVIALEIAELAELRGGESGLSQKLTKAGSRLKKLQAQFDRVSKQHAGARRRVKLLEDVELRIDTTTGQLLRQQRQTIPEKANLRGQLRDTLQDSAQAQIDLISLEDRQAEILAERVPEGEAPEMAELRATRSTLIREITEDYRSYVGMLAAIVTNLRSLSEETKEFSLFVDQRLLWIPSAAPIGIGEPQIELGALAEFFSKDPFKTLRADLFKLPFLWGFATAFVLVLLFRRKSYLRRLGMAGAAAKKRNCTSYAPTAKAFASTLFIALPIPLLLWFVYSRTDELRPGVGEGIRNSAGFLTLTLLFWTMSHPAGLMVNHFRMAERRVAVLRRNFRWFIPLMVPLVFFATVLPLKATAESAGRLFFIAAMLGLLVFFYRVLHPDKRLIHWRGKAPNRVGKICFLVAVGSPVALILGAVMGYYASVQELRMHALMSVWLVIVTLFVTAMLHRWILVSRRRLAVQKALERRAAAVAERNAKAADPNATPQNVASPEEFKAEAIKVVEVEEQTARLVRAAAVAVIFFGILAIWFPMVPALSALDEVTLWSGGEAVSDDAPSVDHGENTPVGEPEVGNPIPGISGEGGGADTGQQRVTLQDLAGAFIALLLTFVAARNVPGLLELTIFRRLRVSPGASFAFTTTIRYVIVVTGLVFAFGMVGITWSKVQWIAAAITLGIGFGLQEIFANFVAGLIILFERPIRLGDVVTVGDVSGKVTQIRIRATTIRQFNNRELIVPNKEFITGQLVNWTLSDSVLRLEIPVGIAYGSDTELAKKILLRVADENPKVIKEPVPDVLFDAFGDSALSFVLRGFVGSVDDLIAVRNELHFEVDRAFREAGIEIAFPQTDIHIRSLPERAEDLIGRGGEAAEGA